LGKDSSEIGIRLIRFEDESGIIKCNHIEKENVINLLKSIKKIDNYDVEVDTIATSGTIKSLINKHFKLS
jgi:RNase P/RNase MRP subunit POP5